MFLTTAPKAVITGWKGAVEGIRTSVVAVGIPPHQLAASNQSVETPPIQVPFTQTKVLVVIERIPVSAVPKNVAFLKAAKEAVLP